jgi:hypothetical protein
MAVVLGAVEREHARPDDLGGGEPGVVDGERRWVAKHLQGGVSPGDDESAERRDPADRAQPSEVGMRVTGEVLDGEDTGHVTKA